MALNIKDPETENLAAHIAALTHESKTGAIRTALRERKERLELHTHTSKAERLHGFLTEEAWPQIPDSLRGNQLTRQEREEILGYGADGV